MQNYGTLASNYQASILQCRVNTTTNCDSAYGPPLTLNPGEQRTFSQTLTLPSGGSYTVAPYFLENNVWFRYGSDTNVNSAQLNLPSTLLISPVTLSPANPVAGESVTASYTIKNFGSQAATQQTSVLQCRLNTNTVCDSAYGSAMTLNPGEQRTVSQTIANLQPGTYDLVPYFMQDSGWYRYGMTSGTLNKLQLNVPNVKLVGAITTNPAQPIPGQTMTVTYTAKNYGAQAVNYQSSILQCRVNTAVSCDPSFDGSLTLNAGEQRTFTTQVPVPRAGSYVLTPYYQQDGIWYRYGTDTAGGNAIRVDVPAYVASMKLVGAITTNPAQPIPGQPVTVSYTVMNTGDKPAIYQTSILQCRLNTNTVCDPAYDAPVTIDPGLQKTFTIALPAAKAGSYVLTPYYEQNDAWYKYASDTAGGNAIQVDVPAYVADMRLTSTITTTPSQPVNGQAFSVSYTVKNFGDKPAIYQTSILQCRLNTNTNCDGAYGTSITVNPGDQRTFTENYAAAKQGTYRFTPYYYQNDDWHLYKAEVGTNSVSITVQ